MASPLNLTSYGVSNAGIDSRVHGQTNYKVIDGKAVKSLFGHSQFSPFPTSVDPANGNVKTMNGPGNVHGDNVYDTSITKIIEYCRQHEAMKLDYADFAYLKNVGVFPHNRLMIARRFTSGVGNDLTAVSKQPISTLISWVKEGDDFLEMQYGENWTAAEGTFEEVLNNIGEDVKASQDIQKPDLGNLVYTAFSILPLPGFMEGLQYEVLKNLGLTDAGVGNSPLGNPNLIREAQRRTTVEPKRAGSGLMAKFTIKMEVEYEQKFINGVDPTLVYLDIIQNALTFGTSDAFFQFSSGFGTGITGFMRDLISGDLGAIAKALGSFVSSLVTAIGKKALAFAQVIVDGLKKTVETGKIEFAAGALVGALQDAFRSTIGHVISKYKVRLIGIVNAVTGSPSTPWHITIGNPMRPIFSSGDMFTTDVTITLGKVLAFNDLPSSIKISFSLTNARPLGAQEIFNRFNTGRGRSYAKFRKSFLEAGSFDFGSASNLENTYQPQSQTKNEAVNVKVNEQEDNYILKGGDGPFWLNFGLATPDENATRGVDQNGSAISVQGGSPSNTNILGVNVQTTGQAASGQSASTAALNNLGIGNTFLGNVTGANPAPLTVASTGLVTGLTPNPQQLELKPAANKITEADQLALQLSEVEDKMNGISTAYKESTIHFDDNSTAKIKWNIDGPGSVDLTEREDYKQLVASKGQPTFIQSNEYPTDEYSALQKQKLELEAKITNLQNSIK